MLSHFDGFWVANVPEQMPKIWLADTPWVKFDCELLSNPRSLFSTIFRNSKKLLIILKIGISPINVGESQKTFPSSVFFVESIINVSTNNILQVPQVPIDRKWACPTGERRDLDKGGPSLVSVLYEFDVDSISYNFASINFFVGLIGVMGLSPQKRVLFWLRYKFQ